MIFNHDTYSKGSIELAIPEGLGHYHGMTSFLKLDAFIAKTYPLFENKLNLTGQIQTGFIMPTLGCKKTSINDRFFVASAFGYSHMGHYH